MKTKTLTQIKSKIAIALFAGLSLAPCSNLLALSPVLPINANSIWGTLPFLPWGLNTAVIAYPGPISNSSVFCGVATCSGGGAIGFNTIYVNDYTSGMFTSISSPVYATSGADIIVGNSTAAGGRTPGNDLIIATAFANTSGNPQIDFYDVRISPFSIFYISSCIIPGTYTAETVHIDAIADYSNTLLTGYPFCDKFMIAWDDWSMGSPITYVAEGDLTTQSITVPATSIGQGGLPDVAGVKRGTTFSHDDWALIAYTDGFGTLEYAEWDATTSSLTYFPVLDNNASNPRIDAFDDYNVNGNPAISQYKIVAQVLNLGTGAYETREYDNLVTAYPISGVDNLAPWLTAPYHCVHPCVALYGPNDYAILHVDDPLSGGTGQALICEPVDISSPTSLWLGNYYKINDFGTTTCLSSHSDFYNAVGSTPNSRQLYYPEVFAWTAWTGLNYQVYYKTSIGLPAFKQAPTPNNVAAVTARDWTIYPNPTTSQLTISDPQFDAATTYRIVDMTGRVALQGRMSWSMQNIDVSKLVSGNYILRVYNNDVENGTATFVKN